MPPNASLCGKRKGRSNLLTQFNPTVVVYKLVGLFLPERGAHALARRCLECAGQPDTTHKEPPRSSRSSRSHCAARTPRTKDLSGLLPAPELTQSMFEVPIGTDDVRPTFKHSSASNPRPAHVEDRIFAGLPIFLLKIQSYLQDFR